MLDLCTNKHSLLIVRILKTNSRYLEKPKLKASQEVIFKRITPLQNLRFQGPALFNKNDPHKHWGQSQDNYEVS
jgi:hypothetical protein